MRKKNIPYVIYGGLSFYQRKEIKDIISYFRLIVNPGDEEAFRRIVNYPTRGIGDVTVSKISETARLHGVSLWQVLSSPLQYNLNVNSGTAKKLGAFHELISGFITDNETLNAYELAQNVLKNTGIVKEAYEDMTPEGMSRAQNIQELLNAINEFVTSRQEEGETGIRLVDFLSEVSLLTDQDMGNDGDNERVTLMTVHSAKGLEFNHVFVVGMEEDLFPSSMAKFEPRGLEEERRLFYVAITRAKKTCTISFAKSRFRNGSTNATRESRFLQDIDPQFLLMERNTISSFREGASDGFWESMRQKRESTVFTPSSESGSSFKRPIRQTPVERSATSSLPLSKEALELQKGNIIEHERFGRGAVTAIEQSGGDKRAFVDFDSAGQKQLLLKYAKFTIVG